MRYSIQPGIEYFQKGMDFCFFTKNMHKNIGKDISKNLSEK